MEDDNGGQNAKELLALPDDVLVKLIHIDLRLPGDPETRLPLMYLLRSALETRGFAWVRKNWERIDWLHPEVPPDPAQSTPPDEAGHSTARPAEQPVPAQPDDRSSAQPTIHRQFLDLPPLALGAENQPAGTQPVRRTPPMPLPVVPNRPVPDARSRWHREETPERTADRPIEPRPAVRKPPPVPRPDPPAKRNTPDSVRDPLPKAAADPAAKTNPEPDTDGPDNGSKPKPMPEGMGPILEDLQRRGRRSILAPRKFSRQPELNPPEP